MTDKSLRQLLEIATAKAHSQLDIEMQDRAIVEIVWRWRKWCEDQEHYHEENGFSEAWLRFLKESGVE